MGRFAYDEADDLRRRIHLLEMRITHLEQAVSKMKDLLSVACNLMGDDGK